MRSWNLTSLDFKGHLNVKMTRDLQEATAENRSTRYSLVHELLSSPPAGEQNQPKEASQEKT